MRPAPCHPNRPYFAKNFCKSCWQKNHYKTHKSLPYNKLAPKQRERICSKRREWYKANREVKLKRDADYRSRVKADPVRSLQRLTRHRRAYLRKRYNITPERYDEMVIGQLGLCALCGKQPTKRGLDVDHAHETGQIRELLCYRCNATVIAIVEDTELVAKAKAYLAKHARRAHLKTMQQATSEPMQNETAPAIEPGLNETVVILQESEHEQSDPS